MYQNAGEKGRPHLDPNDPPRRRGNKRPGLGNFDNDRPAVSGVLGRSSHQADVAVIPTTSKKELHHRIETTTQPGATVFTDENAGYDGIKAKGREHKTVNHSKKEYARDEDRDGHCEVHCNGMEGYWTGLRNYLRMFRGVSKWFLDQYVRFYMFLTNYKFRAEEGLRLLLCEKAKLP